MMPAVRTRVPRALLALPLLAVPASLAASGFAIESQGARAMGLAGAYVAQASDPSAIYFNAAGIAFLGEKQLYVGGGFASLSTDFVGAGPTPPEGTLETSSQGLGVLPAAYYSQQVGERTAIGIGVNLPFGNRSQWDDPDGFTGRYICLDCRIRSWGINPTIAYKLADRLAVGAGVDLRFSSFRLSRRLIADPNPFPDPTDVAELRFESGTELGVGFNLGLLARPSDTISIGLAYRHKVTMDHGSEASFVQIPTGNQAVDDAVAAALPPDQPATATFAYPGTIAAGIAWRDGDWTIEGDVAWTLWSSFDRVSVRTADAPAYDTSLTQEWESTWRGALGVERLIGDRWEVRAGYGYDHSPAPTDTISPFIHDADRHAFGAGGTWKRRTRSGSVHVDFFARYLFFRTSSTLGLSRYGYDGSYDTSGFQLGASIGYRF